MTNTLQTLSVRKCTRCLKEKPPTEFYKHKNGRDGLDAHCKLCSKRPVPTLTCRSCGSQWNAQASGRPQRLCIDCRLIYKVCLKCDSVKPHSEFHTGARGACKKCLSRVRPVVCQSCGVEWQLDRPGVPPKLCATCETWLKYCHKCGEVRLHSDFNAASATRLGLNDACRPCAQKWFRERGAHLKRVRELRTKYNVTIEEWDSMWEAQDGKCACCRTELVFKPALDHCHTTGAVRGILCSNCNTGIGKLGDTADGLNRAETYLWSKRNVLAELSAGLHNLSETCFA
ncbi:endonuclease VII domain-containing protein [Mycobacterium intracellulare]|uniref:endonuclease VII domain-containing protein n=1 Tax=Mycobacterium intracellulare TaxID=1767 RepID=UPI00109E7861